jgi:Calcineurin-like phosphoesterase
LEIGLIPVGVEDRHFMENSPENRRSLVVAGDWQGDLGWAIMVIRCAARERANTVLHVGDSGLDWPGAKRDRFEARLNKYMFDFGITLILSGGNHDNWEPSDGSPWTPTVLPPFAQIFECCPELAARKPAA